jgi:hypothetical protein
MITAHRWIMVLAVGELLAIVTGAFQASSRIALNEATVPVHLPLGIAVVTAGLMVCIRARGTPLWLAFAALALSCITGGWIAPVTPGRVVWHALCSHTALALVTAAAVLTSRAWPEPAKRVSAASWGALRPVALITPPAVLLQIAMGALYRHQILGVMWHMLGAMTVAILTLVLSVVLLQHFADQPQLKSAATWLISAVLAQVCLGIAAFLMILLGAGNIPPFVWLATGHVTVGAATFAASVVASIQVRRYVE